MRGWLIRGANLAVLWAIAQTLSAKLSVGGSLSTPIVVGALCLLGAIAMAWGAVDHLLGFNRDGYTWLKAALFAGVLGALLGVLGQAAFVDSTGAWAIGPALVGPAPFIALLVLIPAWIGMLIARFVRPRGESSQVRESTRPRPSPQPRERTSSPK